MQPDDLIAQWALLIALSMILFYVSAKLVRVPCSWTDAAIIVTIPKFLWLIPVVGWILAIIAYFALISKRLDAGLPTTILLCAVNSLLFALLQFGLVK